MRQRLFYLFLTPLLNMTRQCRLLCQNHPFTGKPVHFDEKRRSGMDEMLRLFDDWELLQPLLIQCSLTELRVDRQVEGTQAGKVLEEVGSLARLGAQILQAGLDDHLAS